MSFSFSCLVETRVDDHQAEDLHNDRHVPLNFALQVDLVLGIPQNVLRDEGFEAESVELSWQMPLASHRATLVACPHADVDLSGNMEGSTKYSGKLTRTSRS